MFFGLKCNSFKDALSIKHVYMKYDIGTIKNKIPNILNKLKMTLITT